MTEARPMVRYSRGVMDSVVDKLTDMKDTHPEVEPLLKYLESLTEDLVNKFAEGRATHKQVKVWMKQIRELVYDIEDWIDLKLAGKLDESEMDFGEQIVEFMAKIDAARARSERCNLLSKASTYNASKKVAVDAVASKKVAVDSQLLLEEQAILFGISDPRRKLEEHLKDTQKSRKVVSVLGVGGLGKTTLATKVYEELNGHFECHASVTVGRNSSITALMDVFCQVNPEMLGHDTRVSLNEQEVIPRLWEFLKNKSYFVFIDDIRNTHDWSVINCGLPNNVLESRILTTTRVKDVAMSCSVRPTDVVYKMKPLDKGNSKRLLTTICAKTEDRSANFEKNCDDMLNKCCGIPLAIIVTAGLLATKLADLGPLGKPEESDEMRNVLDICFADLAPPVKACFLYLSTFPENYAIKKGRLIRRWVAEGFIPGRDQGSMLETGESYFNELICRKLIQPVFDDYNDDQAVLCTVNPVIHDFIISLSRQEDFHTTAAELISGPFPYGTIRRFSVDCSRQENNEADTLTSSAVHLSRMRSLTISGDAGGVPDLSTFKHLRVLDLEDTKTFDDNQLEKIGSLFLLRYLGLGGTNVTKLPQKMVELKHLSTLDLRRTSVMELPAVWNTELVSVLADGLIIPNEIGKMERLEELSTVSLLPDDAARLVNKSRQLRMLGVTFGYIYILTRANQQGMKCFLEEVGKSNLHSFLLEDYPSDSVKLLECWANEGPNNLRKLELTMSDCLQVVPPKMEFLRAVTHLHIRVGEIEAQGVSALGSLPNLVLLKLFSGEGTRERLTISSQHGFWCLKVFWFSSYFLGMGLQFEAGAMPQLQRLQMEFHARKTKFAEHSFDFGIQHLCCLQVRAIILCKHATDSEAKAAETAIRDQVSQIPYNPLPVHGDDLRRKEATRETDSSSSTPSVDIRISILPESSSHVPIPGFISFVMEDATVSSSTGAMNSVLTKLATLTGERYAELTGADEQELMMLRDELQVMNALLKQLSDTADLNIQMKECRNQMRELTYGIEDSIDDLLSVNEEGSGSTGKRVMPHDFIEQIQKLNAQVETVDLGSTVRRTEKCTFGPRHMPRGQWLFEFYYDEPVKPCVKRDLPSVETMRKTFAHLSSDMKTCLLYLSSFPANSVIEKDQLIRRWAAEGFLPKRSVESLWETGESYFFELTARKLIELVYDDLEDVLPTGCKVGDSVHGFITALSSEENFVKPGQDGVFWRLSDSRLSNKGELGALFKELSKVRSLTVHTDFGYPWSMRIQPRILHNDFDDPMWMRDLPAFKHLRVLDLEDMELLHEDLRSIGHLSLLRYLRFPRVKLLTFVPQEITALEHLETVELRLTWLNELPAFKSRKLVSLIAGRIMLHEGMGEMPVLEELATVSVGNDGDRLAKVVNQSKRLRRLGLEFNDFWLLSAHGKKGLMDLLGAIGNSCIQSLCLHDRSDHGSVLFDLLLDCWAQQRPRHLQKLKLTIDDVLPEVPRNMSPSLIDLTHLSINVQRVDTGLCILGNLPNLVFLRLGPRDRTERSIISKNGFRCLRVFWCNCLRYNGGMGLQFEAGAMPQLRRLRLKFDVKETESKFGGFDFGIQFLTCLVEVHATIVCCGSTEASAEAVEAAMRDQVSENPNNPVLVITREFVIVR